MKKKIFLVVALCLATVSFAQNTLVATLSHGEDITMYYGTYALRDAMNTAVSGDVINLSGGAFQAVDITKAVTMRGTGIDDANPTFIIGDFTINVPSDDMNRLSMEGIRSSGTISMQGAFNNPYFMKSQFNKFYYPYNETVIKNAMFADCRIADSFDLQGTSSVQFINSYVSQFQNSDATNSSALFMNCVIRPQYDYFGESIRSSQLINCIIYSANSDYTGAQLPSTTVATNCVAVGIYDLFGSQQASTGNMSATFAEVFKEFTGSYSESEQFELTDEAKTTYLGTDGTEVGMHGGMLPYDSKPSYPQITKMNVANKTTADGKLSVEIEVSAAE